MEFDRDLIVDTDVERFMEELKNKKGDSLAKTSRGLSRVLKVLDVVPSTNNPDVKLTDIDILVALTVEN